jgi:type I restriction enzyme S subunit
MKQKYRKIGEFIRLVNTRNTELKAKTLLGINIDKFFMPSVANVVGTDMSAYKIVKKGQFACNRMHVGRDYRLPVALSKHDEDFMVSPAYDVFEISAPDQLSTEYLMMWFSRKEFDRNAWYYTDADVRGGLNWKALIDMTLPVPSIEKQREIVKEYNVITNRIALNNQLIQKLEETAQAIYKQWFVDFEFPDENGKPYKSNGGEMVESELGEIPMGWRVGCLGDLSMCYDSLRKPLSEAERKLIQGKYPYYGAMSIVDYVNQYIYDGIYILFSEDGANIIDEKGHPALQYIWGKFWVNNHSHVIRGKDEISTEYLYICLKNVNVSHLVTGAAQPKINQQNMNSIRMIKPNGINLMIFNELILNIFKHLRVISMLNVQLSTLHEILLSKLATIGN